MRLGQAAVAEELQEPAVVLLPVRGVELRPALCRVQREVEPVLGPLGQGRRRRQRRGDEHGTGDPLGVLGGEQQRALRAPGQRHQHSRGNAHGVHDRECVGGVLVLVVCRRVLRAPGATVAAPLDHDHACPARQIGHLTLPDARVRHRPRRQQDDGQWAIPVHLVVDRDTVAVDKALRLRRPCPHGCLPFLAPRVASTAASRASCPSRTPMSRSRATPWLAVITSDTNASMGQPCTSSSPASTASV